MKISVITVCFNSVGTIEDTMISVGRQDHNDIEHIVVDGASKDGTQDIVSRYRESVAKFISEPDLGIYDAMNKGLGLSTGEVIGFLNADDVYIHQGTLRRVSELMEREELDALLGDVEFVHPFRPNRPLRRYRSALFHPNSIAWGWMPAHPALFLRNKVYERFGKYRTDYTIAGDFELVARIFSHGKIVYRHVPDVLVRMRMGGISTGGWRNTLFLNKEVLRACRENGISTNLLKILTKYPMKMLEFILK